MPVVNINPFPPSSESIKTSLEKSYNYAVAVERLIVAGFNDQKALRDICESLIDSIEQSQAHLLISLKN